MSRVPGRSRVKHLKSPQKPRAGNASRLLRRHLQEPDTGRTAGMSRRGKWVLVRHCSDGRDLAAPLARTFSALTRGRFHESKNRDRKRTRQTEENPTAGVRELRTKHPRKRRVTKIRFENANVRNAPGARLNARAGTSFVIAVLLPCPLLAVLAVNLSKRDAGMRLSVSERRGVISNYVPRRPKDD